MRLWSLHPKYLDVRGLVAAWREGLLAQKVLEGKTKGYRHHPQLARFRECRNPLAAIGQYLREIAREAEQRGYHFDSTKIRISRGRSSGTIRVTTGQMAYEWELLKSKLRRRDRDKLRELERERRILVNRVFRRTTGKIEPWEKIIPTIYQKVVR